MMIGQTLPLGSSPRSVLIDGRRAKHVQTRVTNRGVEVTVPVCGDGLHTLVIITT
jgi:hypothetical protein